MKNKKHDHKYRESDLNDMNLQQYEDKLNSLKKSVKMLEKLKKRNKEITKLERKKKEILKSINNRNKHK